jgi:hypothetical protein
MSVLVSSPGNVHASETTPVPGRVQVRRLTAKDQPRLEAFQVRRGRAWDVLIALQTQHSLPGQGPNLHSPQTLCLEATTPTPSGLLLATLACSPPTLQISTLFITPENTNERLASILIDYARRWAENTIGRCHKRSGPLAVRIVVDDPTYSTEFSQPLGIHVPAGATDDVV